MLGQIGTDEAGYGPNLGPLTITGSLWENSGSQSCLYDALDDSIKRAPGRRKDSRLTVADSKVVYKSSGSIDALETAVLSFLLASQIAAEQKPPELVRGKCDRLHGVPRTIHELFTLACPGTDWATVADQPGFAIQNVKLPLKACPNKIATTAGNLALAMDSSNVRLKQTICRPVFACEFNSGLERCGNKATLLSETTMGIIAELKSEFEDDLEIVCDKHGGRSHYAGLIQNVLTDQAVAIGAETRESSDYFFSECNRDVAIHFKAGGESFMPTAFASMVSKYVREVMMVAWNRFWACKVPNIKPTKGYPVDAKRFKAEIETCQKELQISDFDIWRMR